MPILCDKNKCVGCGACYNRCPRNAISMTSDFEGFLTPQIDPTKCVECGLCEKACPILNPLNLKSDENPDVYACWNNDDDVRMKSSSGGMFSVYADHILANGGVVFGVMFDPNDSMKAKFVQVESSNDLGKLRTSKYVQADVGFAYREAEKELKSGRPVLFVGTPCQIAGLRAFLSRNYENLYACDLVCYGTPSPLIFDKWIAYLKENYSSQITSINMRDKKKGWPGYNVSFELNFGERRDVFSWNDKRASYLSGAFSSRICFRSSCFSCAYARLPRTGDITLADFWGIGTQEEFNFDKKKGVSLNLVNTERGKALVESCGEAATFVRRDLNEALRGNPALCRPFGSHPKRNEFLKDAQTMDFDALMSKYRSSIRGSTLKRAKSFLRRNLSRLVKLVWGKSGFLAFKNLLRRGKKS